MFDRLAESIYNDASQIKVRRVGLKIGGIVQGVGFRPFVHALARQMALGGFVRNEGGSVWIELEGENRRIAQFARRLGTNGPPGARIQRVEWECRPLEGETEFRIERSSESRSGEMLVPADQAQCLDCLRELDDPTDRRYRYPFLSCVNCGPRLTVIESMPYDRERTTYKGFPLCSECIRELRDPSDRRFHAQGLACPSCGPKLGLLRGSHSPGEYPVSDPLRGACEAVLKGEILALKGLGGFQLACDARKGESVRELRRRKRRDEKPLAIMLRNVDEASELCEISDRERSWLESSRRPIVLLRRRPGEKAIANEVSLSSPFLGVMLPSTPLHALLLEGVRGAPLVMTSGNTSDHPMSVETEEALARLSGIAEVFLVHDRPIEVRCDDSVVREVAPLPDPVLIRRARGYVPEPVRMPLDFPSPGLAAGASLKNTFALGGGELATLGPHIGDLDEVSTFESYKKSIRHFERLLQIQPEFLAHDLHPDYLSTVYTRERAAEEGLRSLGVQHHHAHMASCLADNGVGGSEEVIGVVFDGTGYGLDGKIWGGEFLVGGYSRFKRAAHFRYVPMPGGDQAVREPWRMALSHLLAAGLDPSVLESRIPTAAWRGVRAILERRLNCPETSSVGRLFDAVSALIGVRTHVSFEGQAAIELESLAIRGSPVSEIYPARCLEAERGGPLEIDVSNWFERILEDLGRGASGMEIACRFHSSLADLVVRVSCELGKRWGIRSVALSGGVFVNGVLLSAVVEGLRSQGFQVHCHRQVPPHDGGISLGQLAVAAAVLREEGKSDVPGRSWEGG